MTRLNFWFRLLRRLSVSEGSSMDRGGGSLGECVSSGIASALLVELGAGDFESSEGLCEVCEENSRLECVVEWRFASFMRHLLLEKLGSRAGLDVAARYGEGRCISSLRPPAKATRAIGTPRGCITSSVRLQWRRCWACRMLLMRAKRRCWFSSAHGTAARGRFCHSGPWIHFSVHPMKLQTAFRELFRERSGQIPRLPQPVHGAQ